MSKREEKTNEIDLAWDAFYADNYAEISGRLCNDYIDVKMAYWNDRIVSGEVTLAEYRNKWKKDIFDKDWRESYIYALDFQDIRTKYGYACVKRLVDGFVELICEKAFSQDD